MANKRMFNKTIIHSDAFSDMSHDAQLLYVHMSLHADDDGFVDNIRNIIRAHDMSSVHIKELTDKRFVLAFESGIHVIKHWFLHNSIPRDRYKPTKYIEERNTLEKKDDGAYTLSRIHNVDDSSSQIRLDKIRLDKNTDAEESDSPEVKDPIEPMIPLILKEFESINPACKTMYGNKTQRAACRFLVETYGFDKVKTAVTQVLPLSNGQPFFPTITTPLQLQHKFAQLEAAWAKKGKELNKSKNTVAF